MYDSVSNNTYSNCKGINRIATNNCLENTITFNFRNFGWQITKAALCKRPNAKLNSGTLRCRWKISIKRVSRRDSESFGNPCCASSDYLQTAKRRNPRQFHFGDNTPFSDKIKFDPFWKHSLNKELIWLPLSALALIPLILLGF